MQSTIKTGVRLPELDGLRGLAILLVVLVHYVYASLQPEDGKLYTLVHAILPLGWTGVDLFFVLSGFLIGGILMEHRQKGNYFETFYIRRACRILPLYLLSVLLFICCSHIFAARYRSGWVMSLFDQQGIPTWLYFVFLQNFHIAQTCMSGSAWLNITWSLAVEEQFYLITPLLIWLAPPRKLPLILGTLIVLVLIFRLDIYICHPQLNIYVLLPCRADSLLIGALCACWIRNDRSRSRLEKHRDRLYLAFSVLTAGMVYLTCKSTGNSYIDTGRSFRMVSWGYSWIAAFYACLLLIAVTAKDSLITKILHFAPLRRLGNISYCVYLIHGLVIALVYGLVLGRTPLIMNLTDGLLTLVAFVITVVLAAFSWRFFEKPFIRWGHSFSYNELPNQGMLSPAQAIGTEPNIDPA